jgi:glycine oxidase
MPGLALATGHFRNGILLAPLTACLLADAIVSGHNPKELTPFLPDRLPQSVAADP